MRHTPLIAALVAGLLVSAAGCDRSPPDAAAPAVPASTQPSALPEPVLDDQPVVLEDTVEGTSDYLVGISYQGDASTYPGLARQLKAYADSAREEMIQAAQSRPRGEDADSNVPYDLSLSFVEVLRTPQLVSWAADGSSYTGGAHGMPLLARFNWLPAQKKMLTAEELVTDASGWKAISDFAREQLHTRLSQRLEAERVDPTERTRMMRSAGRMIDDGTVPEAAQFAQFEPLPGTAGKLRGLRFVFSPYQVGPYSDGVQTVDVPASVLMPHLAAQYRELFDGGSQR
ncbi:DUF3298 and DUF4163 domain-containing protein [Lysobacter sp. A03]|uniref:DUF3298 and DUF4163 domain-containing protein n=1 Tax=Lysobacter sp. A03 TaxID=1199154 RepID=UPI0005B6C0A3|nr:DUF3298 and DUF4163 domain-containing protein [Lysobacter sp. A03]KIQ96486.1 hypothetical protein TI01_1935 [Lysobacter sp. A03]